MRFSICLLLSLIATTAFANELEVGKTVFQQTCASCHMADGAGLPGAFPPLKQSDYFKKATPAALVKIMDHGLTGEVTVNGQKFNSAMPAQNLSDQEMSDVLNYVSVALNGGKAAFKPEQVKKLRAAK